MDFWERLFARAGRRKPEPSAEAKCAEEWDTELASELSETEREQLKKAGCIRKHIYFSGRVQAVGFRYSARNRIGRNGVGEALRCTWRGRPADRAAAHGCAFRRSEHQPRIFASGVLLLRLPAVI